MIGDTIRKFREERGWTQEELAAKMGYTSKSTINKIEKNINDVSQTKIEKFAEVFECDPTDLIAPNPNHDALKMAQALSLFNAFEKATPEIQQAVNVLLKATEPIAKAVQDAAFQLPKIEFPQSTVEVPHLKKDNDE